MKLLLVIAALSVGLFTSCQPTLHHFGLAGSYLPLPEHLAIGVVNKYYFHYQSEDGYEKSTDILYHQYRQLDDQRLSISIYNPALELTDRQIIRFQEDKMLVEDEIRLYRGETLHVLLENNVLLNWKQDTAQYVSTVHYPYGITENNSWEQTAIRDTTLMNRPAKIFSHQQKQVYQYPDRDDRNYQIAIVDTYVQGFGLFSRSYIFEEGTGSLELVKQMPQADFEALRRKVPPKVAFIDPNNTLDAFSTFAPCNENGQIYDYYNGDPDAHYRPGKRGLWAVFNQQIDPALLGQESGYLTFRFVINCLGEIGWFVTEEADLDFNIKTFPEATVTHLLEIIRQLDDWQPAILQAEAIDVYAYITLKLKDGKVIEILP
jgi:hypothetical protein